ncbi:hypothetical protein Tco_0699163 [Tanacetum coccineum]
MSLQYMFEEELIEKIQPLHNSEKLLVVLCIGDTLRAQGTVAGGLSHRRKRQPTKRKPHRGWRFRVSHRHHQPRWWAKTRDAVSRLAFLRFAYLMRKKVPHEEEGESFFLS